MRHAQGIGVTIGLAATLVATAAGPSLLVDRHVASAQVLPNPYRIMDGWAKLPYGRKMGAVGKVGIAPDGVHIWAIIRCEPLYDPSRFGDECRNSKTDSIYLFDQDGNVVRSFGGGMFIWPHGLTVEPDGSLWITDAVAPNRTPKGDKRGQIVVKFSPEGKVLMTLGTPGEAGSDNAHFNSPSDVAVGAGGDIFVADGHGDNNNRVMKFSKDGTFVRSWGKTGGNAGEFHTLHAIAIDNAGRVFVADRGNNRIQIFDPDGKILTTPWTQFGKPSGIFFDTKGQIYVADSESDDVQNPGWEEGIRIGDANPGWINAFVLYPWGDPRKVPGDGAEFVAVDKDGNMYGGEPQPKRLQKYVRGRGQIRDESRVVLRIHPDFSWEENAMPTYDLTRRLFLGSLGATLALPELRTAAQAPSAASAANVEKDVVYGKAGATDLHLDVYKPTGTANKRMAVIHFHGGGFVAGNKDMLAAQLQALSARGYVNIAAQYRLAGVARWPAQMEDVKASIRWTRANAAKLGIDPARIAVSGYSAGGHLALFAAGTANRPEFEGSSGTRGVKTDVAACLAYFAVTGPAWEGFRRFFPMPEGSSDAAWQAAMPGTYIKSFRPTILFHGLADVTVPPESSLDFLKQLRDARVPSELHTFAGVPHEFVTIPEFTDATAQLADFFLERHVINPRTYPPFGLGRGDGRGTDGGRGAEGRGGRQ